MKKRVFRWLAGLALALILALTLLAGLARFLSVRSFQVRFIPEDFCQSDRALNNPDRGFYSIQAYTIQTVSQTFQEEEDWHWPLQMVQINLRKFRDGPISQTGLQNVEALFAFLRGQGRRYLVRFLYDWDGQAGQTEPETLEVVLTHMRQLSPILKEYDDCVFVLQGLFVGNWGEMNGTPFTTRECLERLTRELAQAAGEGAFLSVRTPAQWRSAVGAAALEPTDPLASRLGLFNDGILGNSTDCGTYAAGTESGDDPLASRSREEELAFQEELCKYVPNGGEVILENPLNDFDSALEAFRTMHITYLNWDYDRAVLEKWAAATVEEAPFQGMDGLTYMERHLGYRYYIEEALLDYDFLTNRLRLGAALKNDGFAPCYTRHPMTLTLVGEGEILSVPLEADLRELAGGTEREQVLQAQARLPLTALGEREYRVYLAVEGLELANHQQPGKYGIFLGQLSFQTVDAQGWLPRWIE